MASTQDYYNILGVSRNATFQEIKRAYMRKRREYVGDEEKTIALSQAYEHFRNSQQFEVLNEVPKEKTIQPKFREQLDNFKEKIRNCENSEQKKQYLPEMKEIYLDVLKTDGSNREAIWNLANIEELLEDKKKAISYLQQLEKDAEGKEKLEVYHHFGELYKKDGNTEEVIKYFSKIYQEDVSYAEDMKTLVRIFYEEKKNPQKAVQILNDCINRCSDARLKVLYLCETLRAIQLSENASNQKLEDALYQKLKSFDQEDVQVTEENAEILFSYMQDTLERKDFKNFHKLEEIYQIYDRSSKEELHTQTVENKPNTDISNETLKQEQVSIKKDLSNNRIEETPSAKKNILPIVLGILAVLLIGGIAKIAFTRNQGTDSKEEQEYLENHNYLLNDMEMQKIDVLEQNYDALTNISIHFVQGSSDYIESLYYPSGDYIWLGVTEGGYKVLNSNYLMDEEREALWKEIQNVYSTDEIDYKKAEQFYELAYKYICKQEENMVIVPNLLGMTETEAQKALSKLELYLAVDGTDYSSEYTENCIMNQHIDAEQKVAKKTTIHVNISLGENYELSHDDVLTESELAKNDILQRKYAQKTDVDIRLMQVSGDEVVNYPSEEEPAIWFVIRNYGDEALLELSVTGFDDKEELYQRVTDIYSSDDTDYEKCEQFYECAYQYVIKNK